MSEAARHSLRRRDPITSHIFETEAKNFGDGAVVDSFVSIGTSVNIHKQVSLLMAEVRDRATVQAHQAVVEKSVVERTSGARDVVKKLYKSAKRAAEVDIAAGNDECTAMFIQAKSDARAFATYYRDNMLGPEGGGQADKVDRQLIDFEKQFELKDGVDSEEQVVPKLCLELAKFKDKFIHLILNKLLEEATFERMETELQVPSLALCSREMQLHFNFFQTFRGILKTAENMDVLRAELGVAEQLREKEMQMEGLQEELLDKGTSINDLKAQIHAFSSEVTRTHMITRQQDAILELEAKSAALEKETDAAKENLRRAVQARSQAEDLTAHTQKQLSNVRKAYDRDIAKLRPLLEDQVNKSQQDLSDIRTLRVDSSLNAVRLKDLENKIYEAQTATNTAQVSERKARKDQSVLQETVKSLESEIERQQRTKMVVIAAKLHFQEIAKTLERQVVDLEKELEQTSSQNDEYYSKVYSLQNELDAAKDQISDSAEVEAGLREKLKRMSAEVATTELQNRQLREDISNSGGDPQAMDNYKDMEQELKRSQENSQRVEKQLRTAMQRVYELQGQLMDKEEADRDRLKAKKAEEAAKTTEAGA